MYIPEYVVHANVLFHCQQRDISLCACCTLHYSETFIDRCNRYFEIIIYRRGSDFIVCRLIDR